MNPTDEFAKFHVVSFPSGLSREFFTPCRHLTSSSPRTLMTLNATRITMMIFKAQILDETFME
jgi:hypothetical protein